MVKKLGILGVILVVVAAAGMVWAESFSGAIPAPQPMVMPASAPACMGGACAVAQPVRKCAPPVCHHKKLTTAIQVRVQYPQPAPPVCPMMGCAAGPPPIPVAVPMWKFIVPWPPFVYYLPVE
jgi:hypothetical protein